MSFAATAIAWVILARVAFSAGPHLESKWIRLLYEKKRELAASPESKVFFVGGSATHFGVNASLASRQLGVPCLNYGSHAGLTLDFLLNEADLSIRPGDLVVLNIEYDLFASSTEPSKLLMEYLITSSAPELKRARSRTVFQAYLAPDLWDLRDLFNTWYFYSRKTTSTENKYYDAKTIDSFGDETRHAVENLRPVLGSKTSLNSPLNPSAIRLIRQFVEKVKHDGVTVVAANPPWLLTATASPAKATLFSDIKDFYTNLGVPMVNEPYLRQTQGTDFFDTVYHLTDHSAVNYTTSLCEGLNQCADFQTWKHARALVWP